MVNDLSLFLSRWELRAQVGDLQKTCVEDMVGILLPTVLHRLLDLTQRSLLKAELCRLLAIEMNSVQEADWVPNLWMDEQDQEEQMGNGL